MDGIFVTGTDTEVGKTAVGAATIAALCDRGFAVAARKPIESGCQVIDGDLHPADGATLHAAAGARDALATVTPWRLRHAISPERAARLEGLHPTRLDLLDAARAETATAFAWIEGAGGFLSPLTSDALNADLAAALGLPVVVVAADRLGCINHVLLTVEAVRARDLEVAAVVVNRLAPVTESAMANRDDLAARLDAAVIGCELGPETGAIAMLVDHLMARRPAGAF
jgi:dethiobiotin synthetase